MLLRAAIVMLVMLNLGAAGWWAFAPAPPLEVPRPEGPGLRLLAEAVAESSKSSARDEAPVPAAASPAPAAPAPARPSATVSAAESCQRFGPFADAAAREAAQAALGALGASVRAVPAAGKARGWKVFLPPQPSREAAQALAARLQAAGVRDLFVLSAGADANGIALGRFSSEAGARRRAEELAAKGVQAQVAPVAPAGDAGWLDARIPAGVEPARLTAIAPARAQACPAAR